MLDLEFWEAREKPWQPIESPTAARCLADYLAAISKEELDRCHWSPEVENERSRRRGNLPVFLSWGKRPIILPNLSVT